MAAKTPRRRTARKTAPGPRHRTPSIHDHFLPHEGNGFTPHALRHGMLAAYSGAMIILKAAAIALPLLLPQTSALSSALTPPNVLNLVNENRRAANLPALTMNRQLGLAAQAKANDMARTGYFAHTSPSGETALTLMRQAGYTPLFGGENLAVHFTQAEDADRGWMASPSHRANILESRFVETGIGIAQGDFEGVPTTFVVELFGTPRPAPVPADAAVTTTVPALERAAAVPAERVAGARIAPVPAVTATASAEADDKPKVRLRPTVGSSGLAIDVSAASATRVAVQAGGTVTELARTLSTATETAAAPTDRASSTATAAEATWTGHVSSTAVARSSGDADLNVLVQRTDGKFDAYPVAHLTTSPDPKDLFLFREAPRTVSFFGLFSVSGLEDQARRVYVLAMVALSALLLLNIFVRIHEQRMSVIFHAATVIGLAAFLYAV